MRPLGLMRMRVYAMADFSNRGSATRLLDLIRILERDFWANAVNALVLIVGLGWGALRWIRQGDAGGWWLPLQLIVFPVLMAAEEFLHLTVMAKKGLPPGLVDLVVVQRIGRSGFSWLCCGAAARFRGKVSHRDRIHIAAPGPILSLVLMALWWLACGLLDRHLWWGRAHLTALPTFGYLASSWVPLRSVLAPDVVVILRAGRDAGYRWRVILRECFRGVGLLWGGKQ
jgi:hypothetical protein